jgi:hypothetical protein
VGLTTFAQQTESCSVATHGLTRISVRVSGQGRRESWLTPTGDAEGGRAEAVGRRAYGAARFHTLLGARVAVSQSKLAAI